jgi:His-Xaa-Ser system protein HxsD
MPSVDNFEIDKKENIAIVSVNPKIYPLNVVFSASYLMMDRAFVVIDGNPETEIVVSLRPRAKEKPEALARQFNDELLNYAVNDCESRKTALLREELVKSAFAGHSRSGQK